MKKYEREELLGRLTHYGQNVVITIESFGWVLIDQQDGILTFGNEKFKLMFLSISPDDAIRSIREDIKYHSNSYQIPVPGDNRSKEFFDGYVVHLKEILSTIEGINHP